MKVILITGASLGIGLQTAQHLAKLGYRVFGTSRTPRAIEGIEMLELEVNNQASAERCMGEVVRRAGRLDILINNAGYDLYGGAEETTLEEVRTQLETNFFGTVRMIGLALPLLRQQGGGNIINIGSVGGMMGLPYNSAYAASKFALEGYSESLRYELLGANIFVSIIQPAQVNTESLETSITLAQNSSAPAKWLAQKMKTEAAKTGISIAHVVTAVARAIQAPRPKLRYPVGFQTTQAHWLRLVPEALKERLMRQLFQPPKPSPTVHSQTR